MPYRWKVLHARGVPAAAKVRTLSTLNSSTARLGRPVRANINFHLASCKCSSALHGSRLQYSGARWWILTGQNSFRHMLGTNLSTDLLKSSRGQRVGRRDDGDGGRCEGGMCKWLLCWDLQRHIGQEGLCSPSPGPGRPLPQISGSRDAHGPTSESITVCTALRERSHRIRY